MNKLGKSIEVDFWNNFGGSLWNSLDNLEKSLRDDIWSSAVLLADTIGGNNIMVEDWHSLKDEDE